MQKAILIKYGEVALRGKNLNRQINKLANTLRNRLYKNGTYKVEREQGRLIVTSDTPEFDFEDAMKYIGNVTGIIGFCFCYIEDSKDIETIKKSSIIFMEDNHLGEKFTFKVNTRRADKKYPIPSQQVSAIVGEAILEAMPLLTVNVVKPEITLTVEIRSKVYLYTNSVKGIGGLPNGVSGKGMLLLSGGIDSPVAGFLSIKRGVDVEAVYFHSPPFTSELAKEKVCDLAERLSSYSGTFKLHVINFTKAQTYLYENTKQEKLTILLKREMLRIGEKLGRINGCQCVITGDSIGQVASQTMYSLNAEESACGMPIIRPLACYDKQEIIDLAEKIGTFEISARPYEDCCTIFVADHPETHPKTSAIERIDRNLLEHGLEQLIEEAIETEEIILFGIRD